MSASLFLLVTWMLAVAAALLAWAWTELEITTTVFRRFGESSLKRNSIHWLAGVALLSAILICCLTT